MSREQRAALLVAFVALVVALLLVVIAGQPGYEYPGSSIPPF
jgi:hypothetical protein